MFFPTSLLFPELLVSGNNFGKRKEEYQFEAVEPPTSASTPLLVKSALKGGLKNSGSAFFYGNLLLYLPKAGVVNTDLGTQREPFRSNMETCDSRMCRKTKSPVEGSKLIVSAQDL